MAWENVKKLKLSLSQKWISLLNVLKFNIPFRWGVVPENFLQGLSSFREHCPDSDKTGKQQAGYCCVFPSIINSCSACPSAAVSGPNEDYPFR